MIELLAAELDDVVIAPAMLGVTGAALRGGDAVQAAVEAAGIAHIGRDFLVAGKAELTLPVAVAAVMALRALLFVLGMCRAELPGHEQGLRIDRHGTVTDCRAQQQRQYQ